VLLPVTMLATLLVGAGAQAADPDRPDLVGVDPVAFVRAAGDDRIYATDDGVSFELWRPDDSKPGAGEALSVITVIGMDVPAALDGYVLEMDCADDVCYQVDGETLRVQSSTGSGPWVTAWEATTPEHVALAQQTRIGGSRVASISLAVLGTAENHVVLVNNGKAGLLRRDAAGHWARMDFDAGVLTPLPPPDVRGLVLSAIGTATFAAACCLAVAALRGYSRAGSRHERRHRLLLRGAVAVGVGALCLAANVETAAVCTLVLLTGALWALVQLIRRGSIGVGPVAVIVGISAVIAALCYLDRTMLVRMEYFTGPFHGHLLAFFPLVVAGSALAWRVAGRTVPFYLADSQTTGA
jgi:hypothetical protein